MQNEGSEASIYLQVYNVDNKKARHKSSASTLAQFDYNDVEKLHTVDVGRTRGISTVLRKNGKDASPSPVPRSISPGDFATAAKAQENLTRIISCDTSGMLNHQNEGLDIQYSETLVPVISRNNPDPSSAQTPLVGVELHGDNASHDWPAVTDSFKTWRIPGGCINIHTAGVHPCHDIYYHNTGDDQQRALLVTMME